MTLLFTAPFLWVFTHSLESSAEWAQNKTVLWPHAPTLANYRAVLFKDGFLTNVANSVIVAAATTAATLVFGSLAGYALARLPMRGKSAILGFILLAGFFPLTAMIGPLFKVMSRLGLLDTLTAVSISDLIYTLPLATWLLASLFAQLPEEIEEAAMVDGCTRLGALRRVVAPLAAPALATAAVLSFILAWSDFTFSLSFLQDESHFTAPLAMLQLGQTKFYTYYNLTDATVVITALPIVVLVLVMQRRIVSGLTGGAVK
ncbi:MAG TPA: carbohydrate ABC transporter permease [Solirubrobacteraceae bacterium]|nr:carbohydrate ABC transporter permease [Solirubrobacteraceae bacterium]